MMEHLVPGFHAELIPIGGSSKKIQDATLQNKGKILLEMAQACVTLP